MQRMAPVLVIACFLPLAAVADDAPRYEDKTAQEWMQQLATGDTPARRHAAAKLGVGPDAKSAAEVLAELVRHDKQPSVRVCAAAALGRVRAPADIAIRPLVTMLRHGLDYEREVAAEVLPLFGPAALPTLIELVRIKNPDERLAMKAVVRICPEGGSDLPKLMGYVRVARPRNALAEFESGGVEWQPRMSLTDLVQLKSVPTRIDVVPIERPDRRAALAALGRMGGDAQPAIPSLVDLARVEGPEQYAAIEALREMGSAATSALPTLREIVDSGTAAAGAAEHAINWIDPERPKPRIHSSLWGPPAIRWER